MSLRTAIIFCNRISMLYCLYGGNFWLQWPHNNRPLSLQFTVVFKIDLSDQSHILKSVYIKWFG